MFCLNYASMQSSCNIVAIFIVRQMQEKFRAKGRKHYFGFVDWKKLW